MKNIIAASVLAIVAASAGAADLVTNGSFEAGSAGWSSTGPVYIGPVSAYSGCCGIDGSGYPAVNGVAAAFFGGGQVDGGTLFRDLVTTAGATYTVTFSYGAIAGNALQTMTVDALSGTTSLASVSVGSYGNSNQATLVAPYSFTFVADSDTTHLLFTNTSATSINTDAMVDNVSVTSAVPEPETYAMLMAGLGLMGLMARRRKA